MREDEELLAWAFNDAQYFGTVGRLRFRVSHLTTAVLHPEGRMELAKHADIKSLTKFVKLHKPRLRLESLPNEPGLPESWEPLGDLVWERLKKALRAPGEGRSTEAAQRRADAASTLASSLPEGEWLRPR